MAVLINLLPLVKLDSNNKPPQHLRFSFSSLAHTSTLHAPVLTSIYANMALLDRISDVVMKVVPAGRSKPRRSMSGGIGSAPAMGIVRDDVSAFFQRTPERRGATYSLVILIHSFEHGNLRSSLSAAYFT